MRIEVSMLLVQGSSHSKDKISLANQIFEDIKEKIINGTLSPSTILSERHLASEFNVSRAPVREALKRLYQDGWIMWEEHRRPVVSEIKESDVVELLVMREMMEPFACRRIFESGKQELLAGMLATIAREMENLKYDHVNLMKKDAVFHNTIIDFVGVVKLSLMWQKISDEMTRLAIYTLHAKRHPDEVIAEHRMIINALWDNDLDGTLNAVRNHHVHIKRAYRIKQDLNKEQQFSIVIESESSKE